MRWTTKARIQRVLSTMPAGSHAYYLLQRCFGNFRHFSVATKVQQGVACIAYLNQLGHDIDGWRTVEIGTGWTPIIPIVFWINGQRQCDTYDVAPLLKRGLFFQTIQQLVANPIALTPEPLSPAKRAAVSDKLRRLRNASLLAPSVAKTLHECGICYHPQQDAAHTSLPDGSVDLVFSNVVLEHVPLGDVHRLFAEAHRILRPNGFMAHLIDPSDHFSHGDNAISPINFLRFSSREFDRYNTRFLYQNRVRAGAWRGLIEQHGFTIDIWDCVVNPAALDGLGSLPIHHDFAGVDPEDLCTTAVWVIARRRSDGGVEES
jgi:SAM-dependent methyltransferase